MKILIVDDITANRLVIKNAFLTMPNVEIVEADNGQVAVDFCKSNRFDIIFMDIMMPILDGVSAVTQIREFDKDAVIVAASALDDADTIAKMLQAGAEDYLIKPVNMRVMRARLRNYFKIAKYRKFSSFGKKHINLFGEEVYSRVTLFRVNSDTSLIEFWEYFLDAREQVKVDLQFCSAIQAIFDIGSIMVYFGKKFNIYLESSESHSFLTISGVDIINSRIIKEHLDFNFAAYHAKCEYKLFNKLLTLKIDKLAPFVEFDEACDDDLMDEFSSDSFLIEEFMESSTKERVRHISNYELEDILEYIAKIESNGIKRTCSDDLLAIALILSQHFETFYLSVAIRSYGLNLQNEENSFNIDSCARLISKLKEWTTGTKMHYDCEDIEKDIVDML
ncbi:MAG: hypothetical protein RL154_215 [Pseudomonadota bacterium]|jgi:two-component system chemotaxis response regulator CheY